MEKLEEVQQSECPGSYQSPRIGALKGAMVSNGAVLSPFGEMETKLIGGGERKWWGRNRE